MQRRDFLTSLAGLGVCSLLPLACSRQEASNAKLDVNDAKKAQPLIISAAKDAKGYAVYAMNAQQKLLWRFALPERAHDASISPDGSMVMVTGRRPSKQAWLLNSATGQLIQPIKTASQRHFFGHTVFDDSGRYAYSTENNTRNFDGLVVVRDLYHQAQVVAEYPSGGVGPHQLLLMPNLSDYESANAKNSILPKQKMLVIANGGIKTAENSRKKLNLADMQPNLAYMDVGSGNIKQLIQPAHHQMSIRHIAINQLTGQVGIGVQFQGNKTQNIPLLLTHQFGDTTFKTVRIPAQDWSVFNQYIGSVAINSHQYLCATSPRGNCAIFADLTKPKQTAQLIRLHDCCGVVSTDDSFIVSDGFGNTSHVLPSDMDNTSHYLVNKSLPHQGIQWDNHMTLL